jgi:hypothetical protein
LRWKPERQTGKIDHFERVIGVEGGVDLGFSPSTLQGFADIGTPHLHDNLRKRMQAAAVPKMRIESQHRGA